ncbi:membrane protein insertase YidC [Oenococcus sicerae]|uniref:Membrane protein insertase YidC n=1 Tax=Oenococcus sicerae TaxID=2203724 RepID=A0AAJ1R9C6_9LACO|nr:membrane protein insertase YidC [Oenococcus sicerae]MDN6899645.1 membrane protein insertase YidC [Oenococcus sicerae]QAS70333.1 membrane protein insertase YidC [Oenococcus sicerae]
MSKEKVGVWQSIRRLIIVALIALEILLMTGGYTKTGRTWLWISKYMVDFMQWMANDVFKSTNGIGFAIIAITAVIRLILLPIMFDQQRQSTIQAEKMAMLQPQLTKVQAALKTAETQEEKLAVNNAMMSVYRENNVSMMGGMNFLSMLIQLPIISALYTAIRLSTSVLKVDHVDPAVFNKLFPLNGAHFFGIALYKPSLIIAIVAAIFYFAQSWFTLQTTPEAQRKQMQTMIWMSPVMIFFFSIFQSAALGLYFMVGGLFVLIQTLIILKIRPGIQAKIHREFKVKNVADDLLAKAAANTSEQDLAKDITNDVSTEEIDPNKGAHKRNAGKQQRKPKI